MHGEGAVALEAASRTQIEKKGHFGTPKQPLAGRLTCSKQRSDPTLATVFFAAQEGNFVALHKSQGPASHRFKGDR